MKNEINRPSPRAGYYYLAEWRLSKAYLELPQSARDLLFSLLCELRYSKKRVKGKRQYLNNGAVSFTENQYKKRFNRTSETYLRSRNTLIKNGLIKQTYRGGYGKGDRARYKVLVDETLPYNEQRWRQYPDENWESEIPKMKGNHVGKKTRFKKGKTGRKSISTLMNRGPKQVNNPNKS